MTLFQRYRRYLALLLWYWTHLNAMLMLFWWPWHYFDATSMALMLFWRYDGVNAILMLLPKNVGKITFHWNSPNLLWNRTRNMCQHGRPEPTEATSACPCLQSCFAHMNKERERERAIDIFPTQPKIIHCAAIKLWSQLSCTSSVKLLGCCGRTGMESKCPGILEAVGHFRL